VRRRRAVAAGHRGDHAEAASLLGDADPAVRAAALGALARLGALEAPVLRRALADPDPGVRRRGCEEVGRVLARQGPQAPPGRPLRAGPIQPTGDLVRLLEAQLDGGDPAVVEAAAWALGEAGPAAAAVVPRLVSTTRHRSALCREAAVAALGAIGDPAGLPAVLAALGDRPPVRRRAALSLAAFAGAEAEDGLRRAAADRDWQVRQVAEELLREP
jgi:HEAT repeat protein